MSRLVSLPRTMQVAEAQDQFPSILEGVARDRTRVVVEEHGVSVAAIVSTADLARLERLDEERGADFAVIDELRAAFSDVSEAEIECEADRVLGINRGDVVAGQ